MVKRSHTATLLVLPKHQTFHLTVQGFRLLLGYLFFAPQEWFLQEGKWINVHRSWLVNSHRLRGWRSLRDGFTVQVLKPNVVRLRMLHYGWHRGLGGWWCRAGGSPLHGRQLASAKHWYGVNTLLAPHEVTVKELTTVLNRVT